jgi:hypothetical protein
MRRRLFVIAMFFGLALAFVRARPAHAHGGPPAIENVLASDDRGPWLAELSEGFAFRGDGGWSFVCPGLFGADLPPLSATLGDTVWVSGGTELYTLEAAGTLRALDKPELAAPHVLALGALEGALVALRPVPPPDPTMRPGTELIRVQGDTEEVLFEDPSVFWNVMVVQPARADHDDGMVWLARIEGDGFVVLGLDATGHELRRASTPWPAPPLSIRLSTAAHEVFAHVYDNLGFTLMHVASRTGEVTESMEVARGQRPARGPVELDGELVLAQDDRLFMYREGVAEPSGRALGSETLTCLTPDYVCTASRLFAIDSVEQAGGFEPSDALLDLEELAEPALRPDDADLSQYCTAQWLVFQGDLARTGILSGDGGAMPPDAAAGDAGDEEDAGVAPDASADSDAAPSHGCAVAPASDAHDVTPLLSLGLCAAAIYARRRRAQSRAAFRK